MCKRAYKYRFYPKPEQKIQLAQTFGCVRFVYNWGLNLRKTAYKERGERLSYTDLAAMLPWHRCLPKGSQSSSVTISKDCANRYFISILVEEEIKPKPVTPQMVGLDLGLKAMVALSTGEFVRQLVYKSTWYGRTLVKIDRRKYPLSRVGSPCRTGRGPMSQYSLMR
jgi:putative transposase